MFSATPSSEQGDLAGVRHTGEGAQSFQLLDVGFGQLAAAGGKFFHGNEGLALPLFHGVLGGGLPVKKLSTRRLKPLRYLKYAVLVIAVVLLPALLRDSFGLGPPYFCKYLCPQGVLEGAIPLSLADSGIRAALGSLFR